MPSFHQLYQLSLLLVSKTPFVKTKIPSTPTSHFDKHGHARMVNTSGKEASARMAKARCFISISAELTTQLAENTLAKGDAFAVAKTAGIQAAKQTSQLIPLCHPLPLEHIQINITLDQPKHQILIETSATATAKTGMEMESLTAAAITALTIYDMCKAVDKKITINNLQLVEKSGGKSGHWRNSF